MFIKVALTAAFTAAAIVAVALKVNKTAERLENENDELPEDERLSHEEVMESLMEESIADLKKTPIVKIGYFVLSEASDLFKQMWDMRVKVALLIIAVSVFPGAPLAAGALSMAYGVVVMHLIEVLFTKSLEKSAEDEDGLPT